MSNADPFVSTILAQQAQALLSCLARVKPLVLSETMVPAAAVDSKARRDIDRSLLGAREVLKKQIRAYLSWLKSPDGIKATPVERQKRFTLLRLRLLATLSQFDIFCEALVQRSEADTGAWLAGLDAAARDALDIPGHLSPPPVVCYLARDPGGAIRRARTRLPGGLPNPVALIRLPRERMIGAGLASSLVHEVGHQGAAMLDLYTSLRKAFHQCWVEQPHARPIWSVWSRWSNEIMADFWAIARVGVTSTLGLMSIVSLPRAFVFRANLDDPHPGPWLRVQISTSIGNALYPHPQWARLADVWRQFYPLKGLAPETARHFQNLVGAIPELVNQLVSHEVPVLGGRTLGSVLRAQDRTPQALRTLFRAWRTDARKIIATSPCVAFAVIGQARLDGCITPEQESNLVAQLLEHWALRGSIGGRDEQRDVNWINPRRTGGESLRLAVA